MTMDMRKQSPETLDDLYFGNFTIYSVDYKGINTSLVNMIDKERRWVPRFLSSHVWLPEITNILQIFLTFGS